MKKKKQTAPEAPKINQIKKLGVLDLEKSERIKRHKEQAQAQKGRKFGEWRIEPKEHCLYMVNQAGIKIVKYEVTDLEWQSQTGFRN